MSNLYINEAEASALKIYPLKYHCEKHGDIGELCLSLHLGGEQYGKKLCPKCYWDFIGANCCEAVVVKDDNL